MLALLAGTGLRYWSRLGELLRIDGHQVVIAAGFEGCSRFLERTGVDVIVLGVQAGEVFPRGLLRRSTGAALVVLIEPGVHTVPDLPADVTCIQRPNDPQELLGTLAPLFGQAQWENDRDPNRTRRRIPSAARHPEPKTRRDKGSIA